jgi:hypothetical protein
MNLIQSRSIKKILGLTQSLSINRRELRFKLRGEEFMVKKRSQMDSRYLWEMVKGIRFKVSKLERLLDCI